ncbi:hypothetical protein LEMA_P013340.1 [Plenodomus lingam JN3]|uniref:CASTOR ACT domain-containing protein n=2 Tax=Leptosphaeria maculans TaxID=5022 RepID=E5A963_LEPMJ|nr:hypothetical protein LEMA_P013340.1 [Plenodomus lingam JN3]CBY00204.1 hypothetical protein LEMA_P013340.1 [Plenodomus lingam JN3]
MTLLTANIQFLDMQLALIHIPLSLYRNFLQSVLQLLLPGATGGDVQIDSGAVQPPKSSPYEHAFVNISVTPVECSVVCSRTLANEFFVPVVQSLDAESRNSVHITTEDFVVMQVDGEGLDAGQRVLELTSPLALAGIPIFFITTYFSDYILVPSRNQSHVIKALEERGFQFEIDTSSYVNSYNHGRKGSTPSLDIPLPNTPPPATISELQTRTFATLKRCNIVPSVDSHLRLVQCASHNRNTSNGLGESRNRSSMPPTSSEDALHLGLVKCLITQPHPRFLSLTLTDNEPASLLIDHVLLENFAQDTLLGSKDEFLTPIALDLRNLPMESTGIVCGVAGRLVGGTTKKLMDPVEMSYLSTARAGTVMVAEQELQRALGALRGAEESYADA